MHLQNVEVWNPCRIFRNRSQCQSGRVSNLWSASAKSRNGPFLLTCRILWGKVVIVVISLPGWAYVLSESVSQSYINITRIGFLWSARSSFAATTALLVVITMYYLAWSKSVSKSSESSLKTHLVFRSLRSSSCLFPFKLCLSKAWEEEHRTSSWASMPCQNTVIVVHTGKATKHSSQLVQICAAIMRVTLLATYQLHTMRIAFKTPFRIANFWASTKSMPSTLWVLASFNFENCGLHSAGV